MTEEERHAKNTAQKTYYERNKEKARAATKKWKENNPERVREHNARSNALPKNKYQVHKYDAERRGIEWLFTFATWFATWESSGHWEERGTHSLEYCMCRYNDTGAYSADNVYIATNRQNNKDQFNRN